MRETFTGIICNKCTNLVESKSCNTVLLMSKTIIMIWSYSKALKWFKIFLRTSIIKFSFIAPLEFLEVHLLFWHIFVSTKKSTAGRISTKVPSLSNNTIKKHSQISKLLRELWTTTWNSKNVKLIERLRKKLIEFFSELSKLKNTDKKKKEDFQRMRLLTNNIKSSEKNTMISKLMNSKSRNKITMTIFIRGLAGSNLRPIEFKFLKENIKMIFTENSKNGTRKLMTLEIIPILLFKRETTSMLKSQRLNKRSTGKRSSMKKTCMISLNETRWTTKNSKKWKLMTRNS